MYTFAYDKTSGLMVGLLKSKPYFHEDEDYAVLLDSIARNESASRPGEPFKFILVIEPDIPMPNATWRRKFAKSRDKNIYPFLFVTVTPSHLLRGVLTMINWVNPPSMGSATSATATFEEGVEWIEAKINKKLPIAKRLLEEATRAGKR
jgi:hypothetical protein